MKESDVALGIVYKDVVTGFVGTATGITKYLSGCSQVLLVPKVKEDGSFIEGRWFDVQRIEQHGTVQEPVKLDNENKGFDQPAPVR